MAKSSRCVSSEAGVDDLRARVQERLDGLSRAEQKVARYLLNMPQEQLVFATAEELGQHTGTSDATVVRTARKLGYSGLPELKREAGRALVTTVAPATRLEQRLASIGPDLERAMATVFTEARDELENTLAALKLEDVRTAVSLLSHAREVMAFGVGGSELGARHLALRLNRLGRRARFVGSTGFRLADDLLLLGRDDVVVIYLPGRALPELEVLLDHAQVVGARRILISERRLAKQFAPQLDVALYAAGGAGRVAAESTSALTLTDLLVHGVATLHETQAVETRNTLTSLRERLLRK
ncbi:transcriptional regulator, RpiR family [Saccharopolyspora shandongensis]|uniref:Transcriptional regulator, RpiR family n=1 Tax=Saccharopolyspora shandongensis TaxID=418495 RepID=A0A1H3SCD6_9PSEU|nr:MurR/RpiR family transcriptional regulator [Saccharopolyspora shandongensis]SDZ35215.1 transcriptional regulator, RpiR family [Saccharopolyspora shandongensis]